MATYRITLIIKIDVHILAKARRIIVPVGFCIAECFQYGIRLYENSFNSKTKF